MSETQRSEDIGGYYRAEQLPAVHEHSPIYLGGGEEEKQRELQQQHQFPYHPHTHLSQPPGFVFVKQNPLHYPVYEMNEYASLQNLSIDQLRTYILCLVPPRLRGQFLIKNGNGTYVPNPRAFKDGVFANGLAIDPQKIDYVMLAGLVRKNFGEREGEEEEGAARTKWLSRVEEEAEETGGFYGRSYPVRRPASVAEYVPGSGAEEVRTERRKGGGVTGMMQPQEYEVKTEQQQQQQQQQQIELSPPTSDVDQQTIRSLQTQLTQLHGKFVEEATKPKAALPGNAAVYLATQLYLNVQGEPETKVYTALPSGIMEDEEQTYQRQQQQFSAYPQYAAPSPPPPQTPQIPASVPPK